MDFDPALSFSDNFDRFRAEAERIDADCARILSDNLALLARDTTPAALAGPSHIYRKNGQIPQGAALIELGLADKA